MRSFFAPNLNVTPETQFQYLTPPHFVYIGGWALIILLLCLGMPRRSPAAQTRVFRALIWSVVVSEAARIVWGLAVGIFNWQDWLPLHLCATFIVTGPVMLYARNEKTRNLFRAFTYGVAAPAAVFALLTPDKPVTTPFCFEFFQTMYSHGAIIAAGFYICAVFKFQPRVRALPKLLGMLLVWMGVCFAANRLINWLQPNPPRLPANYMFLTFAAKDTPFELFEQWAGPFYILPALGVLLVIWAALFVPWEVFFARLSAKARKTQTAV